MNRRRITAAALAVVVSAASCGSAGAGEVLESDVGRKPPDATAAPPLGTAIDRFGGELFATVGRAGDLADTNVAVSPFSIAAALLMTRAGARGDTRAEIDRVLHLTGFDADAGFNTIDQALAARSVSVKGPDGKTLKVTLSTANALWGQKGYPIEAPFLDVLAADYGAGLHVVDYRANAETARRTINRWVSDRTNDKIRELIPQGVLDAMTRLVLTNAIYLNAAWAEPFDTRATTDGPFTRLDGSAVTARFMRRSDSYRFATGDGWQLVELPYAGDKLAMDVIIPDTGRFTAVETQLASGVGDFVADLSTVSLRFGLPKFTFRTQAKLVDALQALGVESLFDPGRADLSGMSTAEQLYVADVLHEAYIAVTEEGTEAAAATAVVIKATAAPVPPRELLADRPFLFAVRDRETGAVLMLGRVLDPTRG